ncbi:hypothetical protein ACFPC0_00110 [Streptomyces andamanensis]|uniref:Uncharacterized protein n=1 Tax=Streptomyces andamanensis TaxID=1565035 RepID=A0ABV8T881_9ACTN
MDTLADAKTLPPQIRGHASVLRGLFLCTPAPLDRDDWLRLEQIVHSLPGDTELVARVTSGMSMPHWPGISLTEHRHWLEQADAAAAVTSDPVTRAAVAANRVSLLLTLQDAAVRRTLDAAPPEDELPRTSAAPGAGTVQRGRRIGVARALRRRPRPARQRTGTRRPPPGGTSHRPHHPQQHAVAALVHR